MRFNYPDILPCRQCGNQVALPAREMKRDFNITVTCPHCGFVDLAFNIVRKLIHNRLEELGYGDSQPFTPEPIDPVTIIPSEHGFETVIRRNKKGGARMYRRRTRKLRTLK
jgi:hypothetical protein